MSQEFIGNEFRIYWEQNADFYCTRSHAGRCIHCIEGFEALRIRQGPLIGYHTNGCFRSTLNRMERPGRQDKIQSYLQKITKCLANCPIASWQVPNNSTYSVKTTEPRYINNGRTTNKEFWILEPGTRSFDGSFFWDILGCAGPHYLSGTGSLVQHVDTNVSPSLCRFRYHSEESKMFGVSQQWRLFPFHRSGLDSGSKYKKVTVGMSGQRKWRLRFYHMSLWAAPKKCAA